MSQQFPIESHYVTIILEHKKKEKYLISFFSKVNDQKLNVLETLVRPDISLCVVHKLQIGVNSLTQNHLLKCLSNLCKISCNALAQM